MSDKKTKKQLAHDVKRLQQEIKRLNDQSSKKHLKSLKKQIAKKDSIILELTKELQVASDIIEGME